MEEISSSVKKKKTKKKAIRVILCPKNKTEGRGKNPTKNPSNPSQFPIHSKPVRHEHLNCKDALSNFVQVCHIVFIPFY